MAQNRVMSASCSGSEFANYQPTPDDGLWEAGYMIFRRKVLLTPFSSDPKFTLYARSSTRICS